VRLAVKSPDAHVRGLFERFLPDAQRIEVLGPSAGAERIMARTGDARRGAALFSPEGKAAICLTCHFVNGSGHDFGPDLSKVGARLDRTQLLESVLSPSKTITQGFQAVAVTTKDGRTHTGFVVRREGRGLTLKIAAGQTVSLAADDVKGEEDISFSLMPEGLLQSFTAQEASDLIDFLASLR
jgi:putative heme-binding domain-containing protein